MKKVWITASFFAVAVLLSFSAFFAEGSKHKGEDNRVLVEMDNGNITMAEFQKRIDSLPAQSRMKVSVGYPAKERFLNELIRARLFVREARRLKMDEQGNVAAAIEDAVEYVLARYYLKEQVLDRIKVTDEEIKAYIDKNAERFQKPESVRVRQILIKVSKGAAPDDMETARKKAEEILARAKAGEDFVRLVEVYSEDKKGRKRGGDMDYVKKGKMGKEFDALVFNLKPGELSPVIKTRNGFSIFKVEGKKPARKLTIKDVRPLVTTRLRTEKERTAKEKLARELMNRYKVKVHEEFLK